MKHLKLVQTDSEIVKKEYDVVYYSEESSKVVIKRTNRPLKFTAYESGVFSIDNERGDSENHPTLFTSFDGQTWTPWNYTNINVSEGQTLYVKGDNPEGFNRFYVSEDGDESAYRSTFTFNFRATCSGNIMSLLGENITEIPCEDCFRELFIDLENLMTAPELPATTLADNCYSYMFSGCTGLKTAPKLPATTLADSCYLGMFYDCSGLTAAPKLPATTLTDACYNRMFTGCRGLKTAPKLPATTLADGCYYSMFQGCTSLTVATELPATTLAERCYYYMFDDCPGLTVAPELPATTLVNECYTGMFYDCRNLNSIKVGATSWNTDYARGWLTSVSNTGTFTKPSGTSIPSGFNGIPSGWTVVNV